MIAPLALLPLLAGCGAGGQKVPNPSRLPLVPGARVTQQTRQCDRGANAYCALELVVVDPQYRNSLDLLAGEEHQLKVSGWSSASPDTGQERAADSPGHRLRVTYATAYGDLLGIDFDWIHRSKQQARALSHAFFAHTSTLSVLLELGPA